MGSESAPQVVGMERSLEKCQHGKRDFILCVVLHMNLRSSRNAESFVLAEVR